MSISVEQMVREIATVLHQDRVVAIRPEFVRLESGDLIHAANLLAGYLREAGKGASPEDASRQSVETPEEFRTYEVAVDVEAILGLVQADPAGYLVEVRLVLRDPKTKEIVGIYGPEAVRAQGGSLIVRGLKVEMRGTET